jgi:hypothetical protein
MPLRGRRIELVQGRFPVNKAISSTQRTHAMRLRSIRHSCRRLRWFPRSGRPGSHGHPPTRRMAMGTARASGSSSSAQRATGKSDVGLVVGPPPGSGHGHLRQDHAATVDRLGQVIMGAVDAPTVAVGPPAVLEARRRGRTGPSATLTRRRGNVPRVHGTHAGAEDLRSRARHCARQLRTRGRLT